MDYRRFRKNPRQINWTIIKNEFSFYQPEAYTKNPNRTPHAVKIPSLTKKLIASDGSLAGIVM